MKKTYNGFSVGDHVIANGMGVNGFTGQIISITKDIIFVDQDKGPKGWECKKIQPDGRVASAYGAWDNTTYLELDPNWIQVGPINYAQAFQSQYNQQYTGNIGITPLYMAGFATITTPSPTKKKEAVAVKKKESSIKLESVVMSDEKREQIHSAISQIENYKKIFDDWGFEEVFEKGTAISLLFWGIPGTGKTLTAQAIADELKMKLKVVSTAEIESSEPGGAERAIQEVFKTAKGTKTIILFDECDSLLTDRNEVGVIIGAQINCLLTEIEKYEGVVIFTTNRLGKLDPALERRITAKIEFEFPSEKEREAIWRRMLPKKAPLDRSVDFKKLATFPLAGGNIKNSVLNAARSAAYRKDKAISMTHFKEAIEKEAESLAAFISEYEDQSHSSPVGMSRSSTGVTVTKGDVIKTKGGKRG